MARQPRVNVEDGIYQVYARGNGKARLYLDDADRRIYLRILGRTVVQKRWRCLAFCLMNNHVHLLLETPDANLSAGMQRMHGRYAQTFNGRHGRVGHVFQGRFGAIGVRSDEQLIAAAAYIARNPVDAGLCDHPAAWPWSSFGAVLEGTGPAWLDAPRLLSWFSDDDAAARRHYATACASNLKGV
jgi:REP element-mobilizing transposase RayT